MNRAPRANVRLSVDLTIDGSSVRSPAVSVNIPETGVLVRAGQHVERGTSIGLEFKEFKAEGEVIWTRTTEDDGVLLGMRFSSISRRDRRFVRSLIEAAGGF